MADALNVVKRDLRGTKRVRRLRNSGMTPAILYGHGKDNVALAVPTNELHAAIRHGSQFVALDGDLAEDALIKEVQWDAFGSEILHVDLTRVLKSESVEVALAVELRGDAPGSHEGGIVEQPIHQVDIICPVTAIPEKLELNINTMGLGDALYARDIGLPDGARLVTGPDTMVVHCVAASEPEEEPVAEVEASAEPEVIGRKPEDEEESSDK